MSGFSALFELPDEPESSAEAPDRGAALAACRKLFPDLDPEAALSAFQVVCRFAAAEEGEDY